MTRWPDLHSLPSVPLAAVGSLKPCEVLYEFDGPCIFTAVTPLGTQVLAYFSEEFEEEHLLRYLVATTSDGTVGEMKKGVIAVREALERGSLWLVDVDPENVPLRAFALRRDQVPTDALPAPGTMLWASLEPA